MYLTAVMDWHSRHVLSWRLSNTLEGSFCLEALASGRPEIFNTDQGSQYTAATFTGRLADRGIQISMDGRGRWLDNVFIERLWRSVKYECIYPHGFATVPELHAGLESYFDFYSRERFHQGLSGRTPLEVYSSAPACR
jgi:putative transposase